MYYVFIVDTDSYSGNFERKLCAHITGTIGDCEVGKSYIDNDIESLQEQHPQFSTEQFNKFLNFFEMSIYQKEEEGFYRPCSIWDTPGRSNNGNGLHYTVTDTNEYKWPAYESVAIFFYNLPDDEILEYMYERAKTFYSSSNKTPKILGFRLQSVHETVEYRDIINIKL